MPNPATMATAPSMSLPSMNLANNGTPANMSTTDSAYHNKSLIAPYFLNLYLLSAEYLLLILWIKFRIDVN